MQCDICNTPGMGTVVRSAEMTSAVRRGFNPVRLHMLPEAMLRLVGGMAYANRWEEQATTGPLSHSDWNVCEDCMSKLKPYLGAATHAGRNASEPLSSEKDAPSKTSGKSQCFVATAAMGCDDATEVVYLRRYRDDVLIKTAIGALLVATYETVSPPLARFISTRDKLRAVARRFLVVPLARLANRRCQKEKGDAQ